MTHEALQKLPIRVGIFDSIANADEAVAELLAAGFDKKQITVICSEHSVQRHFQEFERQDKAGSHTPAAALTGGACGAGLAAVGAVALASIATMGGAALLAAGGIALWGGAAVGGLVGAMMTRGFEKELANYYDQAVQDGKILVAAEEENAQRNGQLAKASEVFARLGTEPLPLREG